MTLTPPDHKSLNPDKTTKEPKSLLSLGRWIAEESRLFDPRDSPFQASVDPGDPKLLLIVGENASGKSLFFRMLCSKIHLAGSTAFTISIRERSGGGTGEMNRMRQVMMFGEEAEQSTGATSVKVIDAGFNQLKNNGNILGLDEPEMGLSDGYAYALGRYIGDKSREIPKKCRGVVVVTHNRHLVEGLIVGHGKTPTFVRTGSDKADIDTWLTTPEDHTVAELLALPEVGLERWRAVNKLLKDK